MGWPARRGVHQHLQLLPETIWGPTYLQTSTIIPVSTATITCLNDYRLVALTSVIWKCFERLVKTTSAPLSQTPWIPFSLLTDRTETLRTKWPWQHLLPSPPLKKGMHMLEFQHLIPSSSQNSSPNLMVLAWGCPSAAWASVPWQTGLRRWELLLTDPEHRCTSGRCAQPPAVLLDHTRRCATAQLYHHR